VAWGATLQSPGVCELTSEPDALSYSLGSISDKRSKHFDKVKELLELMGTVEVEENFLGTRWSKLLINASFSGMSAVLGCTFGEAAGLKNHAISFRHLSRSASMYANAEVSALSRYKVKISSNCLTMQDLSRSSSHI
jgi:ketopantoate reductase